MSGKRFFAILSTALTLAAFLFIGKLLWQYGDGVITALWARGHLALFLGGGVIYSITGFLLAVSWYRLLRLFGNPGISIRESFGIYARSQMAKYIPGNIFQFAARHVSGRSHGIGHGPLIGSTMYEIAGIAWAAAVLGMTGFLLYRLEQPYLSLPLAALVCAGLFLFPAIFDNIANRVDLLKPMAIPRRKGSSILAQITPIYLLYILFFLVNGGVFIMVANSASNSPLVSNCGLLLSVYSVSWLAGFLTPGAPGGIGVRETVMVLLLAPSITPPTALFAAIFFRLINIAGDILLFLISLFTSRQSR